MLKRAAKQFLEKDDRYNNPPINTKSSFVVTGFDGLCTRAALLHSSWAKPRLALVFKWNAAILCTYIDEPLAQKEGYHRLDRERSLELSLYQEQ